MQTDSILIPSETKEIFEQYSAKVATCLHELRNLIFEVAATHPQIGELEETLKWGQPSYLPKKANVGSTIRIDQTKDNPNSVSVFFICTSGLMDEFREHYPDLIPAAESRALRFPVDEPLPVDELKHMFALALTMKLRRKGKLKVDISVKTPL